MADSHKWARDYVEEYLRVYGKHVTAEYLPASGYYQIDGRRRTFQQVILKVAQMRMKKDFVPEDLC
jgi:hypothetical protein